MVGFVEAEDDIVLVSNQIVDIVVPGPVVLYVSPDHGDELLVGRDGATGAGGAEAVVLRWVHLVVGSDVPVVPPTDTQVMMTPSTPLLTHLAFLKAARSPQWKFVPGGIHRPFLALPYTVDTRDTKTNISFNIISSLDGGRNDTLLDALINVVLCTFYSSLTFPSHTTVGNRETASFEK